MPWAQCPGLVPTPGRCGAWRGPRRCRRGAGRHLADGVPLGAVPTGCEGARSLMPSRCGAGAPAPGRCRRSGRSLGRWPAGKVHREGSAGRRRVRLAQAAPGALGHGARAWCRLPGAAAHGEGLDGADRVPLGTFPTGCEVAGSPVPSRRTSPGPVSALGALPGALASGEGPSRGQRRAAARAARSGGAGCPGARCPGLVPAPGRGGAWRGPRRCRRGAARGGAEPVHQLRAGVGARGAPWGAGQRGNSIGRAAPDGGARGAQLCRAGGPASSAGRGPSGGGSRRR